MNLTTLLNNKHYESDNDIDKLINSYYSLDNYNFIHEDHINDQIINKYNTKSQLKMIDLIDTDNYLFEDETIALFDLSVVNRKEIYDKLYDICTTYENIEFNQLADKYIIKYNNKSSFRNTIAKDDFNNSMRSLFKNSLDDLILKQLVLNLPNIISNEQFKSKLMEDLSYANDNVLRSDKDIENYIKNLELDLQSDNYKVKYVFEEDIKSIDKNTFDKILDKLNFINAYVDSIIIKINRSDTDIEIDNINNTDNFFNVKSLKKLYSDNTSIRQIKMDDILDKKYSITNSKFISEDHFLDNIFKFLNELIKRKIVKIIKIYNKIILKK